MAKISDMAREIHQRLKDEYDQNVRLTDIQRVIDRHVLHQQGVKVDPTAEFESRLYTKQGGAWCAIVQWLHCDYGFDVC